MNEELNSNPESFSGDDRRRDRRVKGILVNFRHEGTSDDFRGVFLKDMSIRGVAFTTPIKLAIGDRIELNIFLTDPNNPAYAKGEVRWVEPSRYLQVGGREHFDAGVEIIEISDDDISAFDKYLNMYDVEE